MYVEKNGETVLEQTNCTERKQCDCIVCSQAPNIYAVIRKHLPVRFSPE